MLYCTASHAILRLSSSQQPSQCLLISFYFYILTLGISFLFTGYLGLLKPEVSFIKFVKLEGVSIIFNFNIIEIFGKICEFYSPKFGLNWVINVYWGLRVSPAGIIVPAPMLGIITLFTTFHSFITVAVIPCASLGQG